MNAKDLHGRAETWSFSALAASLLALLLIVPGESPAQVSAKYRLSQRATVSQTVATTLISVDYSRPRARGRSPLFGKVVHWGEVWTPGANEATKLELSKDVKIEGHSVPAGRWSVWMIPSNVGPWELVLDPRDTLFHVQRPKATDERQIRIAVKPQPVEHVEALTWSFPRVENDAATLQMAWGTTMVPVEIKVEFAMPVTTIAADEAALYIGDWIVSPVLPNAAGAPTPPPVPVQVRYADRRLILKVPPGAFGPPPESVPAAGAEAKADSGSAQDRERAEARRLVAEQERGFVEFLLVPRARGIFAFGWMEENGELLDVEEIYHEFEFEGGRAVRYTVRNDKDQIFARAKRAR